MKKATFLFLLIGVRGRKRMLLKGGMGNGEWGMGNGE